ncbi:hypothetical protein EDB85DRAFT_2181252 [Lactarius pseudohatsudake]|nr:hypothetical protein EDB85DRAFT_2181252 [Lactarius pseudohatsudake]
MDPDVPLGPGSALGLLPLGVVQAALAVKLGSVLRKADTEYANHGFSVYPMVGKEGYSFLLYLISASLNGYWSSPRKKLRRGTYVRELAAQNGTFFSFEKEERVEGRKEESPPSVPLGIAVLSVELRGWFPGRQVRSGFRPLLLTWVTLSRSHKEVTDEHVIG